MHALKLPIVCGKYVASTRDFVIGTAIGVAKGD